MIIWGHVGFPESAINRRVQNSSRPFRVRATRADAQKQWGTRVSPSRAIYARGAASINICGVMRFEGLTAVGVRVLPEFERRQIPDIRFTFGPLPEIAVVRWDSFVRLAVVSRMAGSVTTNQDDPEQSRFLPPDSD
jgi:hypothetical protein